MSHPGRGHGSHGSHVVAVSWLVMYLCTLSCSRAAAVELAARIDDNFTMTKRRLREGLSRGFARTNRKVSSRMQLPDWARVPQLRGLAHALTPVAPPVGHERLELGGGLSWC